MWTSVVIIFVCTGITLLEVPYLLRQGFKRELYAFAVLLLFGAGLGLAVAFRIKIPNPFKLIEVLYNPLSERIYTFFQ